MQSRAGSSSDHVTPEQKRVLQEMGPIQVSGQQTPEQAENLAVRSFLHWCELDGLRPLPPESEVRAELHKL